MRRTAYGPVRNALKLSSPIQGLPQIPSTTLKRLKATCIPYIGMYWNTTIIPTPTAVMRYRLFWRGKSWTICASRPRPADVSATGLSVPTEPLRRAREPSVRLRGHPHVVVVHWAPNLVNGSAPPLKWATRFPQEDRPS